MGCYEVWEGAGPFVDEGGLKLGGPLGLRDVGEVKGKSGELEVTVFGMLRGAGRLLEREVDVSQVWAVVGCGHGLGCGWFFLRRFGFQREILSGQRCERHLGKTGMDQEEPVKEYRTAWESWACYL